MAKVLSSGLALLLSSSPAFAAASSASTAIIRPYAGAYQPIGKDEIGLWSKDDRDEKVLANSAEIFDAPALREYVHRVLCKTVGDERCKSIRIYLIRTPQFNASMTPNGTMRVYSGLFLRLHSESELGGILGHEFGHFENRHTLSIFKANRSGNNLLAWAAVISAMASNYGYRDTQFDDTRLTIMGELRRFSRDQEREADIMSVGFLNRSALRPQAAAHVWHTFMEEQEQSAVVRGLRKPDFRAVAFFADHPPDAERAATFERFADPVGATRDEGVVDYREAITPWLPTLLADQTKLGDFGGSDYLIKAMADAIGWTPSLYFARGELYRLRGNPRDLTNAADFYKQAVATEPNMAEAHRGLGIALIKLGQVAAGQESLRTYLQLSPGARDAPMIATLLQSEAH